MVFGLTVVVRVGASAARFGLTLLAVFLVLLGGVAVVRLSAIPSPVLTAYSAESSPIVQVRAKKTAKPVPAPAKEELLAEEPDETAIPLGGETGKVANPPRPAWVDRDPCKSATRTRSQSRPAPRKNSPNARRPWIEQLNKAVAAYIDDYFEPETAGPVPRLRHHPVRLGLHQEALGEARKHLRGEAADVVRADVPDARSAGVWPGVPQRVGRIDEAIWNVMREKWPSPSACAAWPSVSAPCCACWPSCLGYFRLDTATRGYYTGRLQFLAATAILIVMVAGAVAGESRDVDVTFANVYGPGILRRKIADRPHS